MISEKLYIPFPIAPLLVQNTVTTGTRHRRGPNYVAWRVTITDVNERAKWPLIVLSPSRTSLGTRRIKQYAVRSASAQVVASRAVWPIHPNVRRPAAAGEDRCDIGLRCAHDLGFLRPDIFVFVFVFCLQWARGYVRSGWTTGGYRDGVGRGELQRRVHPASQAESRGLCHPTWYVKHRVCAILYMDSDCPLVHRIRQLFREHRRICRIHWRPPAQLGHRARRSPCDDLIPRQLILLSPLSALPDNGSISAAHVTRTR